MPFQKGQSGNPAGKPKGTQNKTDEQVREFLRKLTAEYIFGNNPKMSLTADLEQLKPGLRAQVFEKYMKYHLSSLANIQIEGEITNNVQGAVRIIIEEVETTKNYIDISPNRLAERAIINQDDLNMHYVHAKSADEDDYSTGF